MLRDFGTAPWPNSRPPVDVLAIRACRACSRPLDRRRRSLLDRVVSVLIPVARYRCRFCGWEGLRSQSVSADPMVVDE